MDNDTVSYEGNLQNLNEENQNYLGIKREADSDLSRGDEGKKDKTEHKLIQKIQGEDTKLKFEDNKEAENLCQNLQGKKDEKNRRRSVDLHGESMGSENRKQILPPHQCNFNQDSNVQNSNKDKEHMVKIGEFVILEKDGPDNESDIVDEEYDKDNSFHNQTGAQGMLYNQSGNLVNSTKRNENQKLTNIIMNVESYKSNPNKSAPRKCVCCDRTDLYPSELLKFKTVEEFLVYFKFLYDKRVNVLKTDEDNFEYNRHALNELINTLYKIIKFNLKSIKYLCKTCLVTKLNQVDGLNFIYRAMEIHVVLENYSNNMNINCHNQINYQSISNQGIKTEAELNASLNISSPLISANNPNNQRPKKNLFEIKSRLEDNTPIDHQLIENLKMGLTPNTNSTNIINSMKAVNMNTNSFNISDNHNKTVQPNSSLSHSQIFNKISNVKEENINNNMQNSLDNLLNNPSINNLTNMNLNSSNPNLNMNANYPLGLNRNLDISNILNMTRLTSPNMSGPMNNTQSILQKIAEVQGSINNLNNMNMNSINPNNQSGISNAPGSHFMNNLGQTPGGGVNINPSNILNFSNNFNQVAEAINSFNNKNMNHNSNLVNSVSQLAGVISNYLNNDEEKENVSANQNNINASVNKFPESNCEKEADPENKRDFSLDKENLGKNDDKKEDVNVTNIIMNFDKAPILNYMMNVLEDLKKQIVAIQYYSLLQKLFISYIFKNLEVLMEQISNNQMIINNPSIHDFNPNTQFNNILSKSGSGQNVSKGLENVLSMMGSNGTNSNQLNPNLAINMLNMTNLPDFLKKSDDNKMNLLSNQTNPMEMLKNMNGSLSNPGGVNSLNILNFLNNSKNSTHPGANQNTGTINQNNNTQINNLNSMANASSSNQNSSNQNLNSNIFLEHLLKNKGNPANIINNFGNMAPNFPGPFSNLMKQQNGPLSLLGNMQLPNLMGLNGPPMSGLQNPITGLGGMPNLQSTINNISNLNQTGGINNQQHQQFSQLYPGNNMPQIVGGFPLNQGVNNPQFSMMFGGLPNNNIGSTINNLMKNVNNNNNQNNNSNEMNNPMNNQNTGGNSKINPSLSQNQNPPFNLMNFLNQNQLNQDNNNPNNIAESNQSLNHGNEMENNILKFLNNQSNKNPQFFNSKQPEDMNLLNNLNSNNNFNMPNQEQLLQYLMMNQSQLGHVNLGNMKNEKYVEDIATKPNNDE